MTFTNRIHNDLYIKLRIKVLIFGVISLLFCSTLIALAPTATSATKTVTACQNRTTGAIRLSTGNCIRGKEAKVGRLVMLADVSPAPPVSPSLTCAQGGKCAVGNVGPGGGVVFYTQVPTAAAPWRYMEVAPSGWGGRVEDSGVVWCSEQRSYVKDFETGSNSTTNTATPIGSGFTNTKMMLGTCTYGAANVATSYHGGGYSDWYLPSKDELNQLCKYVRGLPWTSNATVCAGGTGPTLGFSTFPYWSSSEADTNKAFVQLLNSGTQGMDFKSADSSRVRPVRAF